jgi:hypothetical protein
VAPCPNLGAIASTAAGFRGAWAWQSRHAGGFLELGSVEATIPTGCGQPNSSDQRHRTVGSRVVYRLSHITYSHAACCDSWGLDAGAWGPGAGVRSTGWVRGVRGWLVQVMDLPVYHPR